MDKKKRDALGSHLELVQQYNLKHIKEDVFVVFVNDNTPVIARGLVVDGNYVMTFKDAKGNLLKTAYKNNLFRIISYQRFSKEEAGIEDHDSYFNAGIGRIYGYYGRSYFDHT